MHFLPEETSAESARVWPALPEVPRYRFVGQLIGEQNLRAVEQGEPGIWTKIFRWIAGLGSGASHVPRDLIRPQTGMVDRHGRILVTDVGKGAVFVFDVRQGKLFVWEWADKGDKFSAPVGIAAGETDEILVADASLQRIVRLNHQGEPLGSIGDGMLQRPTGLARDPIGRRIFVADTVAHSIKIFKDNGALVQEFGQRGVAAGEFNAPTHVTLTGDKLYVTDTLNARVQIFTAEGKPLMVLGRRGLYVGNLTRPKGVTVDGDGNIYLVESYYDHLLIFDRRGEYLMAIGGTGSAIGHFYLPAGTWSDNQGRIYVADMYNGRVVIFQYLGG